MSTATATPGDVKDRSLADVGKKRIEWAYQWMPVLGSIHKEFQAARPLQGMRVSACLHVTTETANLMITLRDGGAGRCAVRLEPAVDAGRRGRLSGRGLRYSDLLDQG